MRKTLLTLTLMTAVFVSCVQGSNKGSATTSETTATVISLTSEEFMTTVADYTANSWKYLGSEPAILDFYATWCPPCKKLSPILDELAKEYEGKIKIYKIDVDKEPEVTRAFGIQSMPTMIFIPMNGDPQSVVGALPKEDLKNIIDEFLLP